MKGAQDRVVGFDSPVIQQAIQHQGEAATLEAQAQYIQAADEFRRATDKGMFSAYYLASAEWEVATLTADLGRAQAELDKLRAACAQA